MIRLAALTIASGLVATQVVQAAGAPPGPAGAAFQQWFVSDRDLGCMDPGGRTVACGPSNIPAVGIFYGNADGGSGTPDAVAVVNYTADPTGNGTDVAAAAFHRDAGGSYRFVRRLNGIEGDGVAPGTQVRFGGGKAVMTVVVLKPTDSRCCPTGRKSVSLALR